MVGRAFPVAIATALAACGAVATTSNDAAESAAQKSAKAKPQPPSVGVPRATNASADQTGSDDWPGEYGGDTDGGNGNVLIRSAGGGAYRVEIATVNPETGCGGSISGVGTVSGNRLSISDTLSLPEYGKAICTMRLTRQGNRLNVSGEGDCHLWSGKSCNLEGTMTRHGAAQSEGTARSATVNVPASKAAQPWIVGAWTMRGEPCGGEGLVIEPDGSFFNIGELGRWQLAGNALTFTVTARGDMGDERPVANPRPARTQILSRSATSLSLRHPDGTVSHLVRCR